MSLPWGVKETIAPEFAELVAEFVEESIDSNLPIEDLDVHFIKGGVKHVKDKHLLIYRYQLN